MKYPNPTFLKSAEKIRHTRRNRIVIITISVCVLALLSLFVLKMASMQEKYRKDFPELVGAATSESTEFFIGDVTTSSDTTTQETTASSDVSTSETPLEPTTVTTVQTDNNVVDPDASNSSEAVTTTTAQDNTAFPFSEAISNTYFLTTHPLQVCSHNLRDQYFDDLKQSVSDYIDKTSDTERICVNFINLSNNESFGFNELDPIVPSCSYALPIELAYYQMLSEGTLSSNMLLTYSSSQIVGNSSTIASTFSDGKQFYLRTCANYAISCNDNVALNMMIGAMGGIENVNNYILNFGTYRNYLSNAVYTDYSGLQMNGKGRTSCYDMANYAEYLYRSYRRKPELYQPLINDLSSSQMASGFSGVFNQDGNVFLHVSGRNDELHAYTETLIIDAEEPFAISIYCECESYERSTVIESNIATMIDSFFNDCHQQS